MKKKDQVIITGQGQDVLNTGSDNLIIASAHKYFSYFDIKPPKLLINCENNIPVSRGLGSSSSAIIAGCSKPPYVAISESWNGSSWTEVSDLNANSAYAAGTGASNTDALIFAGEDPSGSTARTESWDGSSWTEVADLATARGNGVGGAGANNTSALAFGGTSGTRLPNT